MVRSKSLTRTTTRHWKRSHTSPIPKQRPSHESKNLLMSYRTSYVVTSRRCLKYLPFTMCAAFNLTADFVLKIAKQLPRLVKSVVKRRQLDYTYDVSMHGFGSGDDVRRRRIEEMTMKPLVLVGSLIILPNQEAAQAVGFADGTCQSAEGESSFMVVGHTTPMRSSDIRCCKDLICVLHGDLSFDEMVQRFATWERHSFDRVRVELAVGNVASLISSMLHLYGGPQLQVQNDLSLPLATVKHVSSHTPASRNVPLSDCGCRRGRTSGKQEIVSSQELMSVLSERPLCEASPAVQLIRSIRDIAHDPLLQNFIKRPIRLTLPLKETWSESLLRILPKSWKQGTLNDIPSLIDHTHSCETGSSGVCAEDIRFTLSVPVDKNFTAFSHNCMTRSQLPLPKDRLQRTSYHSLSKCATEHYKTSLHVQWTVPQPRLHVRVTRDCSATTIPFLERTMQSRLIHSWHHHQKPSLSVTALLTAHTCNHVPHTAAQSRAFRGSTT